jgi:hypothetical protein
MIRVGVRCGMGQSFFAKLSISLVKFVNAILKRLGLPVHFLESVYVLLVCHVVSLLIAVLLFGVGRLNCPNRTQ